MLSVFQSMCVPVNDCMIFHFPPSATFFPSQSNSYTRSHYIHYLYPSLSSFLASVFVCYLRAVDLCLPSALLRGCSGLTALDLSPLSQVTEVRNTHRDRASSQDRICHRHPVGNGEANSFGHRLSIGNGAANRQ